MWKNAFKSDVIESFGRQMDVFQFINIEVKKVNVGNRLFLKPFLIDYKKNYGLR